MRGPHKLSNILGLYFIVCILLFCVGVMYLTRYIATDAIELQLMQSFDQRFSIAESILTREVDRIENALHEIHLNRALLLEISTSKQPIAQRIFEKYEDTISRNKLDVLLISKSNNTVWVNASAPYPDSRLMANEISEQSRNLLASPTILRFQNNSVDVTAILVSRRIVLEDGEVFGFVVGGTIFDENVSLINTIKNKTKSGPIIVSNDERVISSTGWPESEMAEALLKVHNAGKGDRDRDVRMVENNNQISVCYKAKFAKNLAGLSVIFSLDDDILYNFQKSYNKIWILIAVSVTAFLIISLFVMRHLTLPSLTRLLNYTKAVANKEKEASYKSGPIYELNEVGFATEKMVATINDGISKLKKSEDQYRTLVEKTNDAIFVIQKQTGRYLDANQAAENLTGRTISELKQLTTEDVTPEQAGERLQIIAASIGATGLGAVRYNRPDGTYRIARLNTVSLDSMTVIGIARDITDELATEERLRQSQKMEAIGTLAGGIAHDFNNILSAILGYTELAKIKVSPESTVSKDLEKVLQAGNRAKGLVQQILAFSHQEQPTRIHVHPVNLVKETMEMLRPTLPSTIEIIQHIEQTVGNVFVDPTQVNQILINLCTNAFHAMEDRGGKLEITVKEIHLSHEDLIHETNISAGVFFHLSVSDSGEGIPDEIKDKIFDPYFTTKETGKGTGLGLSQVHGIVKSYGGFVSIGSGVNSGSTFNVFLPISQSISTLPEEIDEHIPNGKERVLFVDDEELLTEMNKSLLEGLGYHVTVCNNSMEALEIFKERVDNFDIVVTDQTMPGITGSEMASKMMQIRPDIPIILCTGYSTTISSEKAKLMGIRAFALKPLSINDIAVLIRKVLDRA